MAKKRRDKTPRVQTRREHRQTTRKALAVPVAQFLGEILAMRKRFSILTVKKGKNSTFSTVDMALGILAIIMLECDRLSHLNTEYRQERLLAHQLGLVRMFEQSTAHRFINRFQGWHINQLERINVQLLQAHGQSFKAPTKVADFDGTTHSVEGRKRQGATPGKNQQKKGNDCYQASASFCNGELVTQKLDKGYVHCKKRFETLFAKTQQILGKIDYLRLDSGYFALEVLLALLASPLLKFVICGTSNCIGVKKAIEMAERQPGRFKRVGGTKAVYVMEFKRLRILKDLDPELRLVLVKTLRQPKKVKRGYVYYQRGWYYYGLVTNIKKEEMHSRKLYHFYQQRVVIEQFFKEIKQSFHAGKLPSMLFRGNEAYLWFVALAYNASIWFKQKLLPKKEQRRMWKTIRRKLSAEAEYRFLKNNFLELTFDVTYPHKRLFDLLLRRLDRLKLDVTPNVAWNF